MSDYSKANSNDIDLLETFAALWAHKFLIVAFVAIMILLSWFRVNNEQTVYTAKAVFKIQSSESSNFDVTNQLGLLASLTGVNKEGSKLDIIIEKISSREFILKMNEHLQLKSDIFFNPKVETVEKNDRIYQTRKLKLFLDTLRVPLNSQGQKKIAINDSDKRARIIEQTIVSNYRKMVKAEKGPAGLLSLKVTHSHPKIAAEYANSLMEAIKNAIENENAEATNKRLNYLSQTLASSLQEMDKTQANLKNYAMQNSSAAPETFLKGSILLDMLRAELKEAKQISRALDALKKNVVNKKTSMLAYKALREEYQMIDDYRFRRILGMSETISAWRWPELPTIEAVTLTLSDRIQRLNVEILDKENDAQLYALSAEKLQKLQRNAKIAEATYTVLIEQVKSQSLSAGFKPDNFKIFEYATTPLSPSAPNKGAILLFGAVVGSILGVIIALLNSIRKNVYYSKKLISADSECEISVHTNIFRKSLKKSFLATEELLRSKNSNELDSLIVTLANDKCVFIINAKSRLKASTVAKVLAMQTAISGKKVLLCDNFDEVELKKENLTSFNLEDISLLKMSAQLDLLNNGTQGNGASMFTSSDFTKKMEQLLLSYDQVIVSTTQNQNTSTLLAIKSFKPAIVFISELRKTKKTSLRKIKAIFPLKVLVNV